MMAILLKLIPMLLSLWPIIQAFFNHQAAMAAGSPVIGKEYLTYVVGHVLAGLGIFAGGNAGVDVLLGYLKNFAIGYRLRMAAKLDSGSSEKEIDAACDRLKRD